MIGCPNCGGPLYRRTCLGACSKAQTSVPSRKHHRDVSQEKGETSLEWLASYESVTGVLRNVAQWRAYRVTTKGVPVLIWPIGRFPRWPQAW